MTSVFGALFERRSAITTSHALWEALALGRKSKAGPFVTESTAMQIAAFSSCVRLISNIIATLPCDILERKDERTRVPAVNHPLRRLLDKPNGWQVWSDWAGMMVSHMLYRGNAYSLITKSDGHAVELLPLHPDQVQVEQESFPSLRLKYTWTAKSGRQYEIGPDDILHFRNLSTDGVMGRSILTDAREALGVAIATQEHASSFWSRSGLPTVVLSHPKTLSEPAKIGLETHFERTYGGGSDQRRVAVIEEGMTITPLSITLQDAQFLETRRFQRSEICGMFPVPPFLIGESEKTSTWGTGVEQQFIGFNSLTNVPLTIRMEQRMKQLVQNRDRFGFKFYTQGLLRGDVTARGQWYRVMREIGAFSTNDVRMFEDMPPVKDGDVYLQPMNLAPLGYVPPAKSDLPIEK